MRMRFFFIFHWRLVNVLHRWIRLFQFLIFKFVICLFCFAPINAASLCLLVFHDWLSDLLLGIIIRNLLLKLQILHGKFVNNSVDVPKCHFSMFYAEHFGYESSEIILTVHQHRSSLFLIHRYLLLNPSFSLREHKIHSKRVFLQVQIQNDADVVKLDCGLVYRDSVWLHWSLYECHACSFSYRRLRHMWTCTSTFRTFQNWKMSHFQFPARPSDGRQVVSDFLNYWLGSFVILIHFSHKFWKSAVLGGFVHNWIIFPLIYH